MNGTDLSIAVNEHRQNEKVVYHYENLECTLIILSGSCQVKFPNLGIEKCGLGNRKSVFDGPASAIYIPSNTLCEVVVEGDYFQIAVITATSTQEGKPFIVNSNEVAIEKRGRKEWTREVHTIISQDHPADKLIIGETFGLGGVWSGYPPHKHDTNNLPNESKNDEVFLFRIEPKTGFGVFVTYSEGEKEKATVVHDMDIVSHSEGYHTVVASAGYNFYYLWALSGENRILKWSLDPDHSWIES